MNRWPKGIISVLICFALAASGCAVLRSNDTKRVEAGDLIQPLNITEVLKRPEAEVLDYFQERREEFERLGSYLLENERVFQTRPVILYQDHAIDKIQDAAVRQFAQRLFREEVVKMVSSLNDDPSKRVEFLIDDEHGLYRQSITYVSLPEMVQGDPSVLNYVTDDKDLGGGWYYCVFHYDKVVEEDRYRELAWSKLSDKDRNTLTTPKEKAIVTVESGANVGSWVDDQRLGVVVSVEFNTELDGLLGPITMFFDPATKELVGGNPRF